MGALRGAQHGLTHAVQPLQKEPTDFANVGTLGDHVPRFLSVADVTLLPPKATYGRNGLFYLPGHHPSLKEAGAETEAEA